MKDIILDILIYFVIVFCSTAIVVYFGWFFIDCEGYWKKKQIDDFIFYINHIRDDCINCSYKGKEFSVRVEPAVLEKPKYYNASSVLINEEVVLTLCCLKGDITTFRKVDYSFDRHSVEVFKIIKTALKEAKKRYSQKISDGYNKRSYFE